MSDSFGQFWLERRPTSRSLRPRFHNPVSHVFIIEYMMMNLSHLFMIEYKTMIWERNNEHRKELKWWKNCNVSTLKCAKGLKTNVRLTLCKLQPVSCLWQMTTNSKNRPCEFTYHMSRFKYRKVMCSKCQVLPETEKWQWTNKDKLCRADHSRHIVYSSEMQIHLFAIFFWSQKKSCETNWRAVHQVSHFCQGKPTNRTMCGRPIV